MKQQSFYAEAHHTCPVSTGEPGVQATGVACSHCGKDPGIDPRNRVLWNGFLDKDTNQHCCWQCKDVHYIKKHCSTNEIKETDLQFPVTIRTTFSEFPVTLNEQKFLQR